MIVSRRRFQKMVEELIILRDLHESHKVERKRHAEDHRCLRIAEGLLTPEQKHEYYRLLSERDLESGK